jgi:hypothetical protein
VPEQTNINTAPAYVVEGILHLDGFEERDPEVVNFVAGSEHAESAAHRALQVGARALGLANTTIDANLVEAAFHGMSRDFDGRLGDAVEQIAMLTANLLDEESGELTRAMKRFAGELDELLGDTFDENSKRSALGKLDRILNEAARSQVQEVRKVVDPDNPDSPLGRHRAEIVKVVRDVEDKLTKAVGDVSEKIAVGKAQGELLEKTSSKGFAFEAAVHESVARIAEAHGDLAEQVGSATGAAGSRAGDEVVTLSLEDTRGVSARYVLEQKDRKLGLKATFEELDRAMANREATVGIAVFSRAEQAPTASPFAFWGNYAIAVLDKDTLDDGPVRLACLWARWMVRRALADDGSDISLDRVAGLIDEARRSMDRVSTIRRCHTSAAKRITEATGQVDEMRVEIEAVLDAIASEIGE